MPLKVDSNASIVVYDMVIRFFVVKFLINLFIRGDIQVAVGCTVAVPLPRSSPLTRPPIPAPELVPPCRIRPLCYYCN